MSSHLAMTAGAARSPCGRLCEDLTRWLDTTGLVDSSHITGWRRAEFEFEAVAES